MENNFFTNDELFARIAEEEKKLPDYKILLLEIWSFSLHGRELMLSMQRDVPLLRMEDHITFQVARLDAETENVADLQALGRYFRNILKRRYPDKKVKTDLRCEK